MFASRDTTPSWTKLITPAAETLLLSDAAWNSVPFVIGSRVNSLLTP